jgi:hypothetical protein
VAEGVSPVATSLAQAIEADRAAVAAGEALRDVAGRTEIVAAAFSQVSRAVRRTVLLAERLDRGWARPRCSDDRHAMARRQIERGVRDAIARNADSDDAPRLIRALAERLDSIDTLDDIEGRDIEGRCTEDVIRDICRGLGVDPGRMVSEMGGKDAIPPMAKPQGGAGRNGAARDEDSLRDSDSRARASPAREHPS